MNQPTQNSRQLRNLLQKPRFQLRYSLYFLLFGVVSGICAHWFAYDSIRQAVFDYYLSHQDQDIVSWFDDAVKISYAKYFVFFVSYAVVCFTFGVYTTHRVVGPIVAIRRFADEIKAGNSSARLKLRPNDDLHEVAEILNEINESLGKKSGNNKAS